MTIDWWTLAIQTVNGLILIWLLGRFFWRPLSAMIEERRAAVRQELAEAADKRAAADAALAEIDGVRAGFAEEREAILAAAQEAGERARAAMLDEAAKQAVVLQEAAAKSAIEKEKQSSDKAWAERASRLAVDIAGRLAARLDGPAIRAAFLDWLLDEIRRLPEATREGVATNGASLEAISARPLGIADQARYCEQIGKAFGARPKIAFAADPALIAGLELRGPHLVLSNSWRADLSRILAELTHDQQS